ncbi:MAG: stage II sporulation protein D [Tepidanaerobacteraceae bacterium]|nr:stage II sporulation protein D [Tepidanaerobacteraceae bacterium]
MKRAGCIHILIFFVFFIVIVIPGLIVKGCRIASPGNPGEPPKLESKQGRQENSVALYINSIKKIEKIPLEEYVKGVVAAEMPAGFDMEAIKAQAVAARTYVYLRWKKNGGSGCSLHPEADVCDDPTHCQAWITKGEMLRKWGIFSYYHYYSKINQAVSATEGMILLYDGKPIDPLFFSTSNGKTENSEEVWEKYIPYLRSVTSPGEETSPRFLVIKQIPVDDVVDKLRQKWPDIIIDSKNPERQWKVLEFSAGGRIKTMQLGNKVIKGTEFRQLFDLNSTDIKWERTGKNIKFTCIGFGHGVGMSQYGANAMARNGATFVDILKHYYTGVEIKKAL